MNEPDVSTRNPRSRVGVIAVLLVVVIGAGVWWMNWKGKNSAEANAIQALRALNKQALDAGEPQPVVMQLDAGQKHVATIIVQRNLGETVPLLAKLHHVTEVYLADTDFDDDDVDALNGLPKLNSLILSNTRITDAGVKQLPGSQLHQLHLAGTSISPAAVDIVGQMKDLEVLDLSNTRAHDNLGPLEHLENLKWLLLRGIDFSQVDDESIEVLSKIPKLSRLTMLNANISREVVNRLKAARPEMNVEASSFREDPPES